MPARPTPLLKESKEARQPVANEAVVGRGLQGQGSRVQQNDKGVPEEVLIPASSDGSGQLVVSQAEHVRLFCTCFESCVVYGIAHQQVLIEVLHFVCSPTYVSSTDVGQIRICSNQKHLTWCMWVLSSVVTCNCMTCICMIVIVGI